MTAILATTIGDQLRQAFPFDVERFPLTGPEGLHTPHYGLFRSDSGECVGVAVTRAYEPHTVDDVCALAEAGCDAFNGDAQVKGFWRDGHHVTIAPSDEYRRSIFGTRDNIWPRLIIRAGYDGRAFTGSLGFYRDACHNLHIMRSAGSSVSGWIKHTKSLRENMDDLRRQFQTIAASWSGVVEMAQQLEAKQVNFSDFIRQVYPLPEDASRKTQGNYERRVERIFGRLLRDRMNTGRPQLTSSRVIVSAWEAFNAVQGYVQHDQRRQNSPSEFERALLAWDDAATARALDLALAV